jgi:hypothetical protein
MRIHPSLFLVLSLCACGDDGGASDGSFTTITTASTPPGPTGPTAATDPTTDPSTGGATGTATADATGDATTEAGTPTTGAGDSEGLKLDIPDGATDTGVAGEGCEKVDFLFVLDNSISMGDEQQNLAASFPGFISTIESTVQAKDYHIMVIDTDDIDKWGEKWDKCYNKCLTDDVGDSCLTVYFDDLICGELPPAPEACDQTLGVGRNKGAGGLPVVCPIDGGLRYMTQDQTDLPGTFQCVAEMGATGNSNERPVDALLQATGDQTAPAGCHPGFLRDDAVLVVTMISDEVEAGSAGLPQDWYDALLARKLGNQTAIVVLALNGDTETMGQECTPTAKISEFVDMFGDRGFIGSICEPDYGPFFADAVDIIDYACEQYVPL